MKKAKSVIIFILAIMPLIVTLLPYIVCWGAESRPEPLSFGQAFISEAKEYDGNSAHNSYVEVTFLDQRYVNDPDVDVGEIYQNGYGLRLIEFFLSDAPVSDGDGTLVERYYKNGSPITYSFLKAFSTIFNYASYINVLPYFVVYEYMMYLFALCMIDMCVSLITFVPRKCKELFDK